MKMVHAVNHGSIGSMVHDITLVWLTEGAGDPFSMSQRKLFKATAARSSYNNNMQSVSMNL